jgi:nitroreductase
MGPRKRSGGRPVLSLDFDGVLHWYRYGWQGPNIIDDEPVPGAVDFVRRAQDFFHVVIYSSRSSHPGGIEAMRAWMEKYGFPQVDFATQKPAAFLTIDDRALTFDGNWPDPAALRSFQPWTRQQGPETPDNQTDTEENSMIKDLIRKSRSVRRFDQQQSVSVETLRELVDLARLAPSGANFQPLKYLLSATPEKNALIFQHLAWAGYLKEWPGPEEGERPTAYIIVLGDSSISKSFGCDHGIAAQTIMLGAAEKGLGGCIIGSIQRSELGAALQIPPQLEILLVLALGVPKEEVVVETLEADGSVRYWRDEQQVHHVPKRKLDDIILP